MFCNFQQNTQNEHPFQGLNCAGRPIFPYGAQTTRALIVRVSETFARVKTLCGSFPAAKAPAPFHGGETGAGAKIPLRPPVISAPRSSRRPPRPAGLARGDPGDFTCAGQINCPLRRDFACGEMLARRFAAPRRGRGAVHAPCARRSFQLHDRHAVLPLAVAAQAEGLHRAVAAEDLVHRLAQGAGPLAVDDAHRV